MFALALRGLKLHMRDMRAWLSEEKSGPPRPAPQPGKRGFLLPAPRPGFTLLSRSGWHNDPAGIPNTTGPATPSPLRRGESTLGRLGMVEA